MTTSPNLTGNISRPEFIALMAALMALNALAIDILLPALPYMGEALAINSENDRQLVISLYMLGFGFTQLVFGPLSDRFGRRTPLLIGLAIYVVAAVAAIFSPSFGILLALRFVQGMGAAGTRVITQSIIRDCYSGRAMAEIMSLVFMVFMAMPIVAPAVGQVLLLTGPWWTIFVFMAGLAAIITLWAVQRLPETLAKENRRPLTAASIFGGFKVVISNRAAISYTLAVTFLMGGLFGFINTAQQIYVGLYDLGALFPLAFAAIASTMAVASFVNAKVVSTYGMRRISHIAIIVFTAASAILLIVSLFGLPPLLLFTGLMAIVMFMFSWAAPNMNTLAMEPLGKLAGTASSVFGFVQTVAGAVLGLFIGRLFDGSVTPIVAGYAGMGALAIVAVLIGEKGKLFGVGEEYQ